jgi:radical SAM superfamily enzyme YgiQ (UPF0313 family)
LLIDDNIVSDAEYMTELCSKIKPLKMKWMSQCAIQIADNPPLLRAAAESGCYVLSLGLESVNKRVLDNFNKNFCDPKEYIRIIKAINKAGIEVASEMIIGADSDTPQTLNETIDFVRRSNIIAPKFYCLTPIPGTDLYNMCKENGSLADSDIFSYRPSNAVINTPNMTAAEVTAQYWRVYKKLYSIGAILKRTLFNKRMLKNPFRTAFFFMVNMVYRSQIKRKIAPNIL